MHVSSLVSIRLSKPPLVVRRQSIKHTSKRRAFSNFYWAHTVSSFFSSPIFCSLLENVATPTRSLPELIFLVWVFLNNCFQLFVVKAIWPSSTCFIFKARITTTEFLKPYSESSTTSGHLSPKSVDISSSLRGIVLKLDSMPWK